MAANSLSPNIQTKAELERYFKETGEQNRIAKELGEQMKAMTLEMKKLGPSTSIWEVIDKYPAVKQSLIKTTYEGSEEKFVVEQKKMIEQNKNIQMMLSKKTNQQPNE